MEPNPERDKYAKAKIEEPNLHLPKSLLKPGSDPTDSLCYMRIFEENTRKAQQLAEAVASGAQAARKVYRIRNKELVKVLGNEDEGLQQIHRVSKATIGILADAESNNQRHSYLDLVGTVEEVRTAEELILDKILKTYDRLIFPIILMPPTIYQHQMNIPFYKVIRVIGVQGSNLLRMEMVSGAWIKIDPARPPPGGSEWERVVNIYGPRPHVIKATSLIQSAISELWESGEAEKKMRQEFEDGGSSRIIDGMKSTDKEKTQEHKESGEEENQKQVQVEEAGSSGTEKEKKQDVEDGETDKGKQQEQHVEDESDKPPIRMTYVRRKAAEKEKKQDFEDGETDKGKQEQQQHVEDESDKPPIRMTYVRRKATEKEKKQDFEDGETDKGQQEQQQHVEDESDKPPIRMTYVRRKAAEKEKKQDVEDVETDKGKQQHVEDESKGKRQVEDVEEAAGSGEASEHKEQHVEDERVKQHVEDEAEQQE